MEKFCNIVTVVTKKTVIPGAIFMACIVLIIVAKVISRKIGISFIPGSIEIIEMLVVLATTMSINYAVAEGEIIVVDIITCRLKHVGKLVCKIIGSVLGMVFWVVAAYASIWYIADQLTIGEFRTTVLGIPYTPFRVIWLIGLIIYCLAIFVDMIKEIKSGATK
jgi:TRAP-type C4-dicarboxylate transport system permease small subunit